VSDLHRAKRFASRARFNERSSESGSQDADRVIEAISKSEIPALLGRLLTQTNAEASESSQLLLRRWAETDPASAARWAALLPDEVFSKRSLMEQVALAWLETDMAKAIDWIRALPSSETRDALTITVVYEASRTDPITSLDLASALPEGSGRDDLLVHTVSQWAAEDVETAAQWAAKIPDQKLRDRLTAAIAVASAEQNPVAAATLLARNVRPGTIQNSAAISIVQRWAQQSPQAAADWVAQFPESQLRRTAFEELFAISGLSGGVTDSSAGH
jgi:hypothetical protein